MGLLEVNQIKTKLEQKYTGLINIVPEGQEMNEHQKRNFLSKALATYSITTLYQDTEDEEIVKCLVDGGEDNGIDLIYYHPLKKELCLVQSKFNNNGDSEPDLGEIKKFRDGIRDLICLKFEKFNEKVNSRKDEIYSILAESELKFRFILVYTATTLSNHARIEMQELLAEINDHREIATFEIVNQNRLHNTLYLNEGSNINYELSLYEWAKYEGDRSAYYGQITGDQIYSLWNSFGEALFDSNIRKALGTTDINIEINETLRSEPELFWYYNNGITIICDEINKKPMFGNQRNIGLFDCKALSIVNGAQTFSVIGKFGQESVENQEKLSEVSVNVKLISVNNIDEDGVSYKDEVFSNRITTKTNRQNSINSRDFLVLDPLQRKFERDLAIESIKYNIMRSEEEEKRDESSFGVKEATRALAFAKDIDSTITVRREISSIFDDLDNAKYKKIFNPSITGFYIWNCVRLQRKIEDSIKIISDESNTQEKAILVYSKEIISRIIFDKLGSANIPKSNLSIEGIFTDNDLQTDIRTILEKIKTKVDESSKNLANIFKSPLDMKAIYDFAKLNEMQSEETEEVIVQIPLNTTKVTDLVLKSQLQNFYDKMENDNLAIQCLNHWIDKLYKADKHKMVYRSNFNIFNKDNEYFLMRFSYHKRLIVSFEFYGDKYQSELYKQDDFISWLQTNMNGGSKLVIDSIENMELFKGLINFL